MQQPGLTLCSLNSGSVSRAFASPTTLSRQYATCSSVAAMSMCEVVVHHVSHAQADSPSSEMHTMLVALTVIHSLPTPKYSAVNSDNTTGQKGTTCTAES